MSLDKNVSKQGNKTNLLEILEIKWSPNRRSNSAGKQTDGSLVRNSEMLHRYLSNSANPEQHSAECLQPAQFSRLSLGFPPISE